MNDHVRINTKRTHSYLLIATLMILAFLPGAPSRFSQGLIESGEADEIAEARTRVRGTPAVRSGVRAKAKPARQDNPPEPPVITLPPVELPPVSESDGVFYDLIDKGGYGQCEGQSTAIPAGSTKSVYIIEYSHGMIADGPIGPARTLRLHLMESGPGGAWYRGWTDTSEGRMQIDVFDWRQYFGDMTLDLSLSHEDCHLHKSFILSPSPNP